MSDTEQTIQLIARVLAWQSGEPLDRIDELARNTWWQDEAQQCAEDLGLA